LNEADALHEDAVAAMARLRAGEWGPPLLPEYVFLETVTVLAARAGLGVAQEEGAKLLHSRETEVVPCSPFFADAFEFFRAQRKTRLSFADAAIVAIARQRGADHILTFDRDFRKVDGLEVVPV
jgi:uncharacterized protein